MDGSELSHPAGGVPANPRVEPTGLSLAFTRACRCAGGSHARRYAGSGAIDYGAF